MYKSAVIIPTIGKLSTIGLSIQSLFGNSTEETLYVISYNPKDKEEMEHSRTIVRKCKQITEIEQEITLNLLEVFSDEPVGFCNAVNKGFRALVDEVGGEENLPETIIVCNDDVEVPSNWITKFEKSLNTPEISTISSIYGVSKRMVANDDFRVGIAGPMSNGVPNLQKFNFREKYEHLKGADVEQINSFLEQDPATKEIYLNTQHLSGFCIALKKEVALALCEDGFSYGGFLDDKNFPIGGFDDNDLAVRCLHLGWKMVVCQDLFIGHHHSQTLDYLAPEQEKGLANRIHYYKKWEHETQRHQKVIGAYRVAIKCLNDLIQMKSSIQKASTILDGFAILLTNNPGEALLSYDKQLLNHLPEREQLLLNRCNEVNFDTEREQLAGIFKEWCLSVCMDVVNAGWKGVDDNGIFVEVWGGGFNERNERNRTHEMAEDIGADWIFSIDHDEVFEDRITRGHIERCVNHPNPQSMVFMVGWINHWESMNLFRVDRPYCERYDKGMYGPRLWRVLKNKPQSIYAGTEIGLHCGNAPDFSLEVQQGTLIRFRHLSQVRDIDRYYKADFYNTIDKEKNPILLGNSSYDHLVKSEAVPVSVYNPSNGLAFSMLSYEGERESSVLNWMERMYSKADRMALVWTGDWAEEDKEWLHKPRSEWPEKENWYETGPKYDTAYGGNLFRVEFLHSKLIPETGLAKCRNAAIDHFCATNNGTLGWFMFMDPDEFPTNGFEPALIRCTEASDIMGWLFHFKNKLSGGKFVDSQSVRIIRLSPNFRLYGRVHETFEKSLKQLMEQGVHPNIQPFPTIVVNNGLSKGPEEMKKKLLKYTSLLISQLNENPFDSASWLSLALQYQNDGQKEEFITCLERSCLTAEGAYLPFREMGIFHLREAKGYILNVLKRANGQQNIIKRAKEMLGFLEEYAPPTIVVDTGESVLSDAVELPPFPYDKIQLTDKGELVIKNEG